MFSFELDFESDEGLVGSIYQIGGFPEKLITVDASAKESIVDLPIGTTMMGVDFTPEGEDSHPSSLNERRINLQLGFRALPQLVTFLQEHPEVAFLEGTTNTNLAHLAIRKLGFRRVLRRLYYQKWNSYLDRSYIIASREDFIHAAQKLSRRKV